MDEHTSEDALTPEQEQLLRTKFRIETEFAVEHGFTGEPTRENIREFILDCSDPERRDLQRRKQRAADQLTALMDAETVADAASVDN